MIALSLSTGVDAGARGRRGSPEAAPRCLVPPAIAGPGRIGAVHRAEPGLWQGAAAFAFRWLRDGLAIAGATAADFVPGAAEDRSRLQVRVTATNEWGSREQLSENAIDIVQAPPSSSGQALPDMVLALHSGEHSLDASTAFTGSALTFGVTGEGVSIDPETGSLTILTDALHEGVTVTVTATNSGGTATGRFILSVAAAADAPALVAAPSLAGTGTIGTAVTVDPGIWSGEPSPEIALRWRCDDVDIPGASGASYVPMPQDDGKALTCRVTATNPAGSAEAVTASLAAAYAAPAAAGTLPDLTLVAGSGPQIVEAAPAFTGEGLRYSVEGAAAEIDVATGHVTIPTDQPREQALVTVTATNSGGTASSSFRVTVVAADAPEVPKDAVPPALAAADWEAEAVRDPLLPGAPLVGMIRILGGAARAATRVYRANGDTAGKFPGGGFEICIPHPEKDLAGARYANCWLWRSNNPERSFHILEPGMTRSTTVIYALDDPATVSLADAKFSPDSDRKTWTVTEPKEAPIAAIAPVLAAAPSLVGDGKIGAAVAVETGAWLGDPAPEIALQWLRDGEEIPGAAAASYTPGPGDDRKALACRVTATNPAGSAAAVTEAVTVSYVAPVARGGLFDEVFDEGTGAQEVDAAVDFEGENLSFEVTGAGATVDAKTGVVSIPTDAPMSGETVTVTAMNSGGAAASAFMVTVEAAEAAGGDPAAVWPSNIAAADWDCFEIPDTERHRKMTVSGAVSIPKGFELWGSLSQTSGGAGLSARIPSTPGEISRANALPIGTTVYGVLYWKRLEDGVSKRAAAPGGTTASGAIVTPVAGDAGHGQIEVLLTGKTTAAAAPEPLGGVTGRALTDAINQPLTWHRVISGGQGTNGNCWGQSGLAMALAARSGDTTADARLEQYITNVLASNNCPICAGGYMSQMDLRSLAVFTVVRHTPRLWDTYTTTRKNRITALIKASLIANAWIGSDTHPRANGLDTSMMGLKRNMKWTGANIANAIPTTILNAIAFFGAPQPCHEILETYNHTAFRSELNSLNLGNTFYTFNHPNNKVTSETNNGVGLSADAPTPTQLQNVIRNWRYFDIPITNVVGLMLGANTRSLAQAISKTVMSGQNNGLGSYLAPISERKLSGHGKVLSGAAGTPHLGTPEAHFFEFDGVDGSGQRSSAQYCTSTLRNWTDAFAAMICAGVFPTESAAVMDAMARFNKAMQVYSYFIAPGRGYDSWAHNSNGGIHAGKFGYDFNESNKGGEPMPTAWGLRYTEAIWHDVLWPWLRAR